MATEARDIQKHLLPNGLVVITETMSHVRSVSVGVWIRNGSRREIAEENGLAHFMAARERVKNLIAHPFPTRFKIWFPPIHLAISAAAPFQPDRFLAFGQREWGALPPAGTSEREGAPETQAPIRLETKRDLEQA